MARKLIAAAAVAMLAAVAAVSAAGGNNNNPYAGASWYSKYLAVTAPATPLCSSNVGDVGQLSFPGTPVNVDASHECGSQSEVSIAINPADPTNVIAGSNEIQRNPMRAMASTDSGATFVGADLPLPPPRQQSGFNFGSDPGVAFDANGTAYYSYIDVELANGAAAGNGSSFTGSQMAVAHSTDGGKTWSATFFAPSQGNAHFNDKPMITVDTGIGPGHFHNRVYVVWDMATGSSSSEKNGNNIVLSHSDDGGLTFSAPVSVSGNFIGRTAAIGADPYVAVNGTLHVAWHDVAHGLISDASSTDGGATFSAPHTIASVPEFQFLPAAQAVRGALVYPACGAAGSSLYCSYTANTTGGVKVFVAKSIDGGLTWPTVTQMPAGGDQFNQWLAVDPSDGSVNVAYYDSQTTGLPSTLYTLARSTDGGATYSAQAVATSPTDESGGAGVNLGNQYGDYEGIAALNGTVRPVWTDRRQDVIDRALREEVFTASLSFP